MSENQSGSLAILAGGLIAGTLDILAAFLNWGLKGARPERVLQGIASGWLGRDAFSGGYATVVMGLAFHFLIAITAAAVFYFASRKIGFLLSNVWAAGALYGVLVYGFMYWVVIPLSRIQRGPFSWKGTIVAVITHVVCVGLPIALTVRRFSR